MTTERDPIDEAELRHDLESDPDFPRPLEDLNPASDTLSPAERSAFFTLEDRAKRRRWTDE